MKIVKLKIEDYLYEFYQKVGESAGGLSAEKVMADALLRLAGGLSLKAEREKKRITASAAPPDRAADYLFIHNRNAAAMMSSRSVSPLSR